MYNMKELPAPREIEKLPCAAPAARVILSFIREPPMSLHPAAKSAWAPPGPIFTHDAWLQLNIH